MRLIHVDDDPEYGVALGSVLVSLLEPEPGKAREFNRWYERDHFYAGCMSGQHFFSGRRFLATRDLRALRYPPSSAAIDDTSIGSFLALYWMERGHHAEAEAWSLERVLWLYENGRMDGGGQRRAAHASFYSHQWALLRDEDGVPPEVSLDRSFPGIALVISERPEGVSAEARDTWLRDEHLAAQMPGSSVASCLSLTPLELPKASPAYRAPEPGFDRRSLEIYFLEETPDRVWPNFFEKLGASQTAAGMGESAFVAGFIPTDPGTDRYVDLV